MKSQGRRVAGGDRARRRRRAGRRAHRQWRARGCRRRRRRVGRSAPGSSGLAPDRAPHRSPAASIPLPSASRGADRCRRPSRPATGSPRPSNRPGPGPVRDRLVEFAATDRPRRRGDMADRPGGPVDHRGEAAHRPPRGRGRAGDGSGPAGPRGAIGHERPAHRGRPRVAGGVGRPSRPHARTTPGPGCNCSTPGSTRPWPGPPSWWSWRTRAPTWPGWAPRSTTWSPTWRPCGWRSRRWTRSVGHPSCPGSSEPAPG